MNYEYYLKRTLIFILLIILIVVGNFLIIFIFKNGMEEIELNKCIKAKESELFLESCRKFYEN